MNKILNSLKKLRLKDGDILFCEHSIKKQLLSSLDSISSQKSFVLPNVAIIFVDNVKKICAVSKSKTRVQRAVIRPATLLERKQKAPGSRHD